MGKAGAWEGGPASQMGEAMGKDLVCSHRGFVNGLGWQEAGRIQEGLRHTHPTIVFFLFLCGPKSMGRRRGGKGFVGTPETICRGGGKPGAESWHRLQEQRSLWPLVTQILFPVWLRSLAGPGVELPSESRRQNESV